MVKIALTFDVEPDLHTFAYKGVSEGIPKLTKILNKHKIKGTFFTTCDCIKKHPKIFQSLQKQGHEIALHGYTHDRFDDLPLEEKEKNIQKSLSCFKKYLKIIPKGFRAPQHSTDNATLFLLEKYGIKYDSSKTPLNLMQFLFFPKRLKRNLEGFFSILRKHSLGKIIEIPPTSFLLPFVSLVVRVFPRALQRLYLSFLSLFFKEIVFYAHSFDFVALPESRIDRKFPHDKFIENLDFLLSKLKQNYKFARMEDLI